MKDLPDWLFWIPHLLAGLVIGGVSITVWEFFTRCP